VKECCYVPSLAGKCFIATTTTKTWTSANWGGGAVVRKPATTRFQSSHSQSDKTCICQFRCFRTTTALLIAVGRSEELCLCPIHRYGRITTALALCRVEYRKTQVPGVAPVRTRLSLSTGAVCADLLIYEGLLLHAGQPCPAWFLGPGPRIVVGQRFVAHIILYIQRAARNFQMADKLQYR
jgi:hypothetical protein